MKLTSNISGLRTALRAVTLSTFTILTFGLPTFEAKAETAAINNTSHDDGGNQRINYSGKLRMLSQRMPAAACVIAYSGNSESAVQALGAASVEFGKILISLRDGNPDMGIIGAEKRRNTLAKLDEIKVLWEPFHAAINDILEGKNIDASMKYLSENNMALLGAAKALVTEESAEYSNPAELTQADALLIDFAGRQRMLTQKIAKESCGVETGNAPLGSVDDMKSTISMFEMTLGALRDGMPAAGVKAPPTDEIHNSLVAATEHWTETKSLLESIAGKGSIGSEKQDQLFDLLTQGLKEMNAITGLYTEYSKSAN
ncbi:type IV pili methyl-accepting chemotaxis transducer N-terminal domain-containing protein [Profundibacter amoris]|uniref:NarX-like N-terminal domain-containing protein n=1 Tax=Profundibacter amoris TaxID=2171755 RepID=A0A347UKU2_9RHOB|nr:type IV pili methyl-accepting chemotaxis transducer N-terminal domain-containing protein [Profundibacter amoris]AXX99470.1 hypothetical protein BAR1_16950 [Profundibacter amoris]